MSAPSPPQGEGESSLSQSGQPYLRPRIIQRPSQRSAISSISASVMIQRRRESDAVADEPGDQPVRAACLSTSPPTLRAGSNGARVALSCTSSMPHSSPRRAPHRPADDRRSGAGRLHVRTDALHMADHVGLFVDAQRLHRHRGGHRMPGIGEAMREIPELAASSSIARTRAG